MRCYNSTPDGIGASIDSWDSTDDAGCASGQQTQEDTQRVEVLVLYRD